MALSDFLENGCCGDALHISYEAREVADEVWVQLQIAVAATFDP